MIQKGLKIFIRASARRSGQSPDLLFIRSANGDYLCAVNLSCGAGVSLADVAAAQNPYVKSHASFLPRLARETAVLRFNIVA